MQRDNFDKITVEISQPRLYYHRFRNEWCIDVVVQADNTSTGIIFRSKSKNKVKKQYYKWCIQGILQDEMEHRFRENKIHFNLVQDKR